MNNPLESDEFRIFQRLTLCGEAYTRLCNSSFENRDAAVQALRDLRTCAADLELRTKQLLRIINPAARLFRDVGPWTHDTLDSKYLNCTNHYWRWVHAENSEQKLKELTAFWNLTKDLKDVCEATSIDCYYKEIVR